MQICCCGPPGTGVRPSNGSVLSTWGAIGDPWNGHFRPSPEWHPKFLQVSPKATIWTGGTGEAFTYIRHIQYVQYILHSLYMFSLCKCIFMSICTHLPHICWMSYVSYIPRDAAQILMLQVLTFQNSSAPLLMRQSRSASAVAWIAQTGVIMQETKQLLGGSRLSNPVSIYDASGSASIALIFRYE